jgi:hypothetical protein
MYGIRAHGAPVWSIRIHVEALCGITLRPLRQHPLAVYTLRRLYHVDGDVMMT